MNRRRFLSVTGATGLLSVSGCISRANRGNENTGDDPETDEQSNGEPTVEGDEPNLTPGSDTTVTVKASNITGMHFSKIPDRDVIEFDFASENLSPAPDTTAESYPPQWAWSSRTSVTFDAPVSVAADAEPGEYPFEVTVSVRTDNDGSSSSTEEFIITIAEN